MLPQVNSSFWVYIDGMPEYDSDYDFYRGPCISPSFLRKQAHATKQHCCRLQLY